MSCNKAAALIMFIKGVVHLLGLAYSVVQMAMLSMLGEFSASLSAILAGGVAQGVALIWLSTKVWVGRLIGTTIGLLAFLTFSVGIGTAVAVGGREPVPASSWTVLLCYTLALLAALSCVGTYYVSARR